MAIAFYSVAEPFGEFSNFAPYGVELDGRWYPTVEHYFQAMKFRDAGHAEAIRRAANPKLAKQLGHSRRIPLRDDWEAAKVEVMRTAVRKKFATHPALAALLLGTGDAELIEAAPSDYFWGCGQHGGGQNWLGRILMEVRAELRSQAEG
ncbi:GTP cyclohydrolase II [Lacipirellula parvula]|uniref:GTP cyclohydrolase II n=2 Tax=Lacipirellula parvula TaxID=2650471 RepID=A0A5K7XHJ8_9BACT|nr:GTP cyclohydrolase II [Lacipirellula parvula]